MIAPQIFQTRDAPRYLRGFTAHIIIYAVYIILVVATRILLLAKNKIKIKTAGGQDHVIHDLAFLDLTDQYVLQIMSMPLPHTPEQIKPQLEVRMTNNFKGRTQISDMCIDLCLNAGVAFPTPILEYGWV